MAQPPAVPTTLVPELLGFSPQMLLDDIINTAADAILQCQQAMEPFMQRWADARTEKVGEEWDGLEVVEQGLVAFSTLLESYTDIAFDFFELWSLRNIFAVPPELPLVAPHHKGLDLTTKPDEERELMTEIEELRRKIENQKRLKRMYSKALKLSEISRRKSERLLKRLEYLADIDLKQIDKLVHEANELFENVASLPHIDPTSTNPSVQLDPSKRLWETGKTGYVHWAVNQLIAKSKEKAPRRSGNSAVSNAVEQASAVGETSDIKAAVTLLPLPEKVEYQDAMDTS